MASGDFETATVPVTRYDRGNRLVDGLAPAARSALTAEFSVSAVRTSDVLWDEPADLEFSLFPIDCAASVVMTGENGATIGLRTVGSEGMLAFAAIAYGGSPPGRCICTVRGTIASIPIDRLDRLAREHRVIADAIAAYTHATLYCLTKAIYCNRFHSLSQRSAKYILDLHDRAGGRPFELTQEMLADMLGGGRASVALRAEALQAGGLIAYRRGMMKVLDADRLGRSACPCYAEVKAAFEKVLAR
jgi:CRP-like cAMP-binding protein